MDLPLDAIIPVLDSLMQTWNNDSQVMKVIITHPEIFLLQWPSSDVIFVC